MHSAAMAHLIVEQAVKQFHTEFNEHLKQAMVAAVMPQIEEIVREVAKAMTHEASLYYKHMHNVATIEHTVTFRGPPDARTT